MHVPRYQVQDVCLASRRGRAPRAKVNTFSQTQMTIINQHHDLS